MATKKEVEGVEGVEGTGYIVIDSLKHNGVDYKTGESIELSEKDAQVLLDLEVIALREV